MALLEYEGEYNGHIRAAEQKLDHAEHSASFDERRSAAAAAERALEAAKDVVQLMELEGRSLLPAARQSMQAKLKGYRADAKGLQLRVREARSSRAGASGDTSDCIREELFSPHGARTAAAAANPRALNAPPLTSVRTPQAARGTTLRSAAACCATRSGSTRGPTG
jgi:hypothetical protein